MDYLSLINNVEPYSTIERKRVLDSANGDYIEIGNDYGAINSDDIFIDVDVYLDTATPTVNGIILGVGEAVGNYIQLRQNGGPSIVYLTNGSLGAFATSSIPITTGVQNIRVENRNIYIDNVLKATIGDSGSISPNYVGGPVTVGKRPDSTSSSFYLDGEVNKFTFQSDIFNLNEGNGRYVYSDGSIKIEDRLTLDSANTDYLSFNSVQSVSIGDELELIFDGDDLNTTSYFFNSSSPAVFRVFTLNGVVNSINGCTLDVLTADGIDINVGVGTDLTPHTGKEIVMKVTATVNTDLVSIAARGNATFSANIGLKQFTFSGEVFPLNETNGTAVTGSSGTELTINTSHSGGLDYVNSEIWDINATGDYGKINTASVDFTEYVNHDVIQRVFGSGIQRKRVFDSSNTDYITSNKSGLITNASDLSFDITYETFSTSLVQGIYTVGIYNSALTGAVYVRQNTGASSLNIAITDENLTNLEVYNTGSVPLGKNRIRLDNLQLFLNEVLVHTFTEKVVNIDSSIAPVCFGGFGYSLGSFTLDGEMHKVMQQGETFNLNEGNGATVTGSNGTIGTFNTSHAGGINYINHEAIQGI